MTLLSALGFTLNILPFMFLMTYQRPIWWIALAFFLLAGWFYLKGPRRIRDRQLLLLNSGLLLAGLPFGFIASFMGGLRPIGFSLALLGLVMLFLGTERTRPTL